MKENQVVAAIKNQIQSHPWPWLGGVALIFLAVGFALGGM